MLSDMRERMSQTERSYERAMKQEVGDYRDRGAELVCRQEE